ncbi:FMN-dependent NADH-azoreductase [Metamycoplasma subdolum]|uniref:FMN dependent NADH:quinone oxidoreductase n=1 Tax=Metamycoplasma subdolum TaxID=92407 RepID=A0A3M0AEA3_9BACT|nr:FMN-dependent NADH-azoreductase [Metamycoplasma subdolum]RMA77502.1 FMN-dependent NADH-azoreductase [Metamycoplasma subdolum]WPB50694.1 FMN-dependent NADH-azoreductase [Metamycoplasma subdolum]
MKKVLILHSSPILKDSSFSYKACEKFVEFLKEFNPTWEFKVRDLNLEKISQKTLTSQNMKTYWNEEDSDFFINELKESDYLIVSSSMINFNVPATLKNYLDHICVANKTFSYKYAKENGSVGLLNNLKVKIISSQGAPLGWYPFSNTTSYLKGTFEFLGMQVTKPIVIAGTKVKEFLDKTKNADEWINSNLEVLKEHAKEFK